MLSSIAVRTQTHYFVQCPLHPENEKNALLWQLECGWDASDVDQDGGNGLSVVVVHISPVRCRCERLRCTLCFNNSIVNKTPRANTR